MMKRTAIIMAGGAGERFWPLSRMSKPKQLLNLSSPDKMMIEEAIDRVSGIVSLDDILIITNELLQEPIRKALPNIPKENVIAEPAKRNTAPCLALGSAIIKSKYKDYKENQISVAVLTADHTMTPIGHFQNDVVKAFEYVEKNQDIVTFGIKPYRIETGYGYIETNSNDQSEIKQVISFKEKPNTETAEVYVNSGNFYWNSGMFFFRLDTFIAGIMHHLSEVGSKIETMTNLYSTDFGNAHHGCFLPVKSLFESMPNISIDYGLMEKATNIKVLPATFEWDDIGSWDSLDRVRTSDQSKNILSGNVSIINTTNSIILNESNLKDKILSVIGLDNVVVVITDDAVLVCNKNQVQDVKKTVEDLKSRKEFKFL